MSELFDVPEANGEQIELPAVLPILPLKDTVVFPQAMSPLAIGQERSIRAIDDVVAGDRRVALIASRDGSVEAPGFDDVYRVGTVAVVHKLIKVPDGTLRILVQGLERVHLDHEVDVDPYLLGEFSALPDVLVDSPEVEALTRNVQGCSRASSGSLPTCRRSCSWRRPTSTTLARFAISSPRPCERSPSKSGSRSSRRSTSRRGCAWCRRS